MSTGTPLVEPLKLHTSDTEGIGLRWSPQMARLMGAVPSYIVERREKRRAAILGWHTDQRIIERLCAVPGMGSRNATARDVVLALAAVRRRGGRGWKAAAGKLGHGDYWLVMRDHRAARLVAGWYDRGLLAD